MTITGVPYLMLGVRALARSLPFYRDQVGLRVTREIPGLAFLDAGNLTLVLAEGLFRVPEAEASPDRPAARAGLEIVLGVPDVDAAYAELQARGVAFVREPRPVDGANHSAVFADPDGQLLSVFGPRPSA